MRLSIFLIITGMEKHFCILSLLVSHALTQGFPDNRSEEAGEAIPSHFKRTSALLGEFALPTADKAAARLSFLPGQKQRVLQGEERERLVAEIESRMNILLAHDDYYATAQVTYAAKCAPGPEGPILVQIKMRKTTCKVNLVPVLGSIDECTFAEPAHYISCVWQGNAVNGNITRTLGVMCYNYVNDAAVEHREGLEDEICEMYKYPKSEVLRLIVPYKGKEWNKEVLVYKPQEYNAVYKSGSTFEDKLKEIEKRHRPKGSPFKRADKNPAGRTGLAGRGQLPEYGLNHLVIPVLMRENYGVPEVLIEVDSFDRYGRVQLPQSFEVDPETNILGAELTQAFQQLFTTTVSQARARQVFSQAKKLSKQRNHLLYKGFAPDPRSTDDAWVEVIATVYMDKHRTRFGFFDLKEHETLLRYGWRSLKNVTDDKTQTVFIQTLLPTGVNDAILGDKKISIDFLTSMSHKLNTLMLDIGDFFFTGLGLFFNVYVAGLSLITVISELFIYLGKLIATAKPPWP